MQLQYVSVHIVIHALAARSKRPVRIMTKVSKINCRPLLEGRSCSLLTTSPIGRSMSSSARALKFLVATAVILNFSVVMCFLWTFVWLLCLPLGRRVLKREEDRLYAAYAWVIAFFCNQWLDTEVSVHM